MLKIARLSCRVVTFMLLVAPLVRADDGMWLPNHPPLAALKDRYGFEPTPAWLEHVQKSAVRFNNGGSGSFASADGLVLTNHHVASDAIYKLSTETKNYLRDGFHARARSEELKCVDLELNVLMEIEDVTTQVNAGVTPDMAPEQVRIARNTAKAALEKASLDRTGLRSDVVTLYQGGQYHLYRYKRYTDVRLVFAPEQQAAFFGGDPDNFEFPRYNLDVALFRVYENGQPVKVTHYLRWKPTGTTDGELVFIAGHPGSTQRLVTVAELEYARDTQVPNALRFLKNEEVLLGSYSARSAENARRAKDDLFGVQNSRKVYDGRIAGLLDPVLFAAKQAEEQALRQFAQDRPDLGAADAWDKIAAAQQLIGRHALQANLIENYSLNSGLFKIARKLLRTPVERAKPDGERLREYRDSAKTEFELALFSEEPIYEDLEILKIANFLEYAAMQLGAADPAVRAALGGQAPAVRASALVMGTKVKDVAFRKKLYAMTPAELAQVSDPMIDLARALDEPARAARKVVEQQGEVKEQAHARIAKVRYAKEGAAVSPDATFTLRLSFGVVRGYEEGGRAVPAYTQLGGTFARNAEHANRAPFDLPASWLGKKEALKADTPFNFVSTAYIIGGNSGSPVLNRAGEFVGIVFDGNIQSLVWNYAYSETQARALSVDVRGILEAMRVVYGADALVAELLGK